MIAASIDAAFEVAERVSDALARRGIKTWVIGAAAMAAHGYTRATQDIDLATRDVPLSVLREVADELRASGLCVELREPDAADALGGVLRVDVGQDLQVDVVNFGNPITSAGRRLGAAALSGPAIPLHGWRLGVIELVPLILLKLAGGSRFDLHDVAELIARHPEVDRDALRATCASLRMDRKLDRSLQLLDDEPGEPPP